LRNGTKSGEIKEISSISKTIGLCVVKYLSSHIAREKMDVTVHIDKDGNITTEPQDVQISYYAFPYSSGNMTQKFYLRSKSMGQSVWRLYPQVDKLPQNPFGENTRAMDQYLEVRCDGYRSEFIPVVNNSTETGECKVQLHPILNKRIAVLDFPSVTIDPTIDDHSRTIAHNVWLALQNSASTADFGYYLRDYPADKRDGPSIEMVNEVLELRDVLRISEEMEKYITPIVSGEGRHLKRKSLDIQYVICGNYELT
jgi:hypothetical protein